MRVKFYLLGVPHYRVVGVIMAQDQIILYQQIGIILSENEKPSMMARQRGTLILTPQWLIWIKETGEARSYYRQEEYNNDLPRQGV